jgi:hypothetical protein
MNKVSTTTLTVGSLILAMSSVVDANAAATKTAPIPKVQGISGQCGGLFGGNFQTVHKQDRGTVTNNGTVAMRPRGDRASKDDCQARAKAVNPAPLSGKPR